MQFILITKTTGNSKREANNRNSYRTQKITKGLNDTLITRKIFNQISKIMISKNIKIVFANFPPF